MNNPHQLSSDHAILDIVGNFFANVHQFRPSGFSATRSLRTRLSITIGLGQTATSRDAAVMSAFPPIAAAS